MKITWEISEEEFRGWFLHLGYVKVGTVGFVCWSDLITMTRSDYDEDAPIGLINGAEAIRAHYLANGVEIDPIPEALLNVQDQFNWKIGMPYPPSHWDIEEEDE